MKNLNKLNNSTKFAPRQSMHPDGDVTQAMNKRAEDVARAMNIVRRNFYERNLKQYDMKRNASFQWNETSFQRLRKVLRDYREEQEYSMRNM